MAKRTTRRTAKGSAWYRKFDGCWYCTHNGKKEKLRDVAGNPIRGEHQKAEAEKSVARLKLGMQPEHRKPGTELTVAEVLESYLTKVQNEDSAAHYEHAQRSRADSMQQETDTLTKGVCHMPKNAETVLVRQRPVRRHRRG